MTHAVGKVYLLGAGPGDPELITARALRRLGECDLVLYDALVHPELLRHARVGAELVFVGKRAGAAGERQSAINERLVREARAGRTVARLKGGDPFMFGRGSEEAEHLAAARIPFEVVPGVTSPLAVCAYAGISLTHRDLSSSVAFLTATESPEKDETAHDWKKLATATQTLVIFMGMRHLERTMARLIENGRSVDEPAAVFQWASLPRQKSIVGTVGTIARLAREAGAGLPALTVIGEVVQLREKLRWYDLQPLFGKRVLVTRPRGQEVGFAQRLRDAGAEPLLLPTIRIAPPEDAAPLAQAVKNAASYDAVVFTSANGVAHFFEALAADRGDARRLGRALVAAIGPATADALAARGVLADVVPSEFRGEAAATAVIEALGDRVRGARVLLPRATVARDVLPDALTAAGARVDDVAAYRTTGPSDGDAQAIRDALRERTIDIIAFTSSSTVEQLVALLGAEALPLLEGVVLASIGPITTETAEKLGLRVAVTATEYTSVGLLDALSQHFAARAEPSAAPAFADRSPA